MKIIITFLLCTTALIGYTQENDYFIVDSDTTFCSNLDFKITAQSYLSSVSYINTDGERVEIKERKNVPNIETFYINGNLIDRVPQKTKKPDKYIKWAGRVVDGKLQVNYYFSEMETTNYTSQVIKFYVKIDGTYYDIRSNDRKNHIIPYLKECSAFVGEYKGDYSPNYEEFVKTIELYNSLCD